MKVEVSLNASNPALRSAYAASGPSAERKESVSLLTQHFPLAARVARLGPVSRLRRSAFFAHVTHGVAVG
jgi:hypothetical protein